MFDKWISADTDRTANGLHYRDLHVDIGSSPTDAQKTASTKLLAEGDFTGQSPRAIRWLNDFLVSTMLHESTHSAAFAGVGNTLGKFSFYLSVPHCCYGNVSEPHRCRTKMQYV